MEDSEIVIKKQIEDLKAQLPKKIRKPKKFPVFITADEFALLIKATSKEHHKLAFLLAFASGLRISEVINLTQDKIDINNNSIFISQGKGKKDRIVPLPKVFKEKHLKLIPFKIGARALEKAFKKSADKAGLLKLKPTLHFHSLRHGFATHGVSRGMDVVVLRDLMGHSDISTTNVYIGMNPKKALDEYQRLF